MLALDGKPVCDALLGEMLNRAISIDEKERCELAYEVRC